MTETLDTAGLDPVRPQSHSFSAELALMPEARNRSVIIDKIFMEVCKMSDRKWTNVLLFIIAICLCLIAARLYDVKGITAAHAQSTLLSRVVVLGCYAALTAPSRCDYQPLRVTSEGFLLVQQ